MDQAIIVEAIGKQLDLLEKISVWALLVSLAIAWAGLQKKDITALGMTFPRREAFAGAVVIYLFTNAVLVILFMRVGDLLILADDRTFTQAFTKLSTHEWILNPFAYFGPSELSRTLGCEGFGLLIVLWWLCHASLTTLIDGRQTKMHKLLIGAFLGLGLLGMVSIERVFAIVLQRGRTSLPEDVFAGIFSARVERQLATFLGIVVGGILFGTVQRLNRRLDLGATQPRT